VQNQGLHQQSGYGTFDLKASMLAVEQLSGSRVVFFVELVPNPGVAHVDRRVWVVMLQDDAIMSC
jgi:hypothetical protein